MIKKRIRTREDFYSFFSDFGKSFSFDFETTSQDIIKYRREHGITAKLPDNVASQALNYYYLEYEAISFCDGNKACVIHSKDISQEQLSELVRPIFQTCKTLIGHNISFDLKVLRKIGIFTEDNKLYCTMVADHLLDEEREHGLKKLAKSILGVEETLTYEEAYKLGGEAFDNYCMNDVIWTWQLCMWQQSRLKEQNLVHVFRDIEMPFQQVLVDMEVNGFLIDLKKAEETTQILLEAKEKFTVEMLEYLGERFQLQQKLDGSVEIVSPINFESPAQLSHICEHKLGLKKVEETDSGAYSVGKVFLKEYENHDFVKILNKYKIASQLYKLFFKPLPELTCGDGVVRASFRDTGTKTGRLSCQKPNLQQLAKPNDKFPIETRACFVAPEGRMLITGDFSGQEVAVMAEISRDETLVKSLNNGYDMHLAVANSFYSLGIPENELTKKHPNFKDHKEKYDDIRSKAKTITFGLCYGKGAYGFAKDFRISEEEAQKLVDKYFEGMHGLKRAIDEAHREVERFGYVTYLSGRRRHFRKIKTDKWEGYSKKNLRQAFNAKIQGFSADMVRMAMVAIKKKAKEFPQYDIQFHATVHDEVVCSCKEEFTKEAIELIKESMQTCVKFCVPVSSDVKAGKSYAVKK